MALTKLQAVNQMLSTIGEDAVNALNTGVEDADSAEVKLDEVKTDVLAQGWKINTRRKTLTKDANNEFIVAGTILSIDTVKQNAYVDVVNKDGKLVDIENDTTVWGSGTSTLYCEIVYDLDFESLPHTLRSYIAARAAREFQNEEIGSANLEAKATRREMQLWAACLADRSLVEDGNPLWDNPTLQRGTYRRNRLYGY